MHQNVLVHFDTIMRVCIQGKEFKEFVKLQSVNDFSDGFLISLGHCRDGRHLQSFLKSHGLECLPPRWTKSSGYYFVQQRDGPFTIDYPLDILRRALYEMKSKMTTDLNMMKLPILKKFDATRDLKGTFYVTGELEK